MFEKVYDDGSKVVIDNGVIAVYRPDGSQVTNSNVDYYFDDGRGYGCENCEAAADLFRAQFYAG